MKVTIKKEDAIRAVMTEPLQSGTWYDTRKETWPNCAVCAVGAVLRGAGLSNKDIGKVGNSLMDRGAICSPLQVEKLLCQGEYLNALSCFYENDGDDEGVMRGTKDRPALVAFITKNFPDSFKFSYEEGAS